MGVTVIFAVIDIVLVRHTEAVLEAVCDDTCVSVYVAFVVAVFELDAGIDGF